MKWIILAIGLMGLVACGADGEPVQPTRDATIVLSDKGIGGVARVGLHQGPLSVSIGVGL